MVCIAERGSYVGEFGDATVEKDDNAAILGIEQGEEVVADDVPDDFGLRAVDGRPLFEFDEGDLDL